MNDSTRTAAGIGGFVLLAGAIVAAVLVAGGTTPAGAAELERFASCDAIEAWAGDIATAAPGFAEEGEGESGAGGSAASGAPVAREASGDAAASAAPPDAPQSAGADGALADVDTSAGGTGSTNTVVEGVDEIDIVELLDGGRALVARNGTLSVVDLTGPSVVSSIAVPYDARISVAGDVVWVAGSRDDGTGVDVRRLRLVEGALAEDGQWSTPGWLVDARRTGDRLHVVAVDQPGISGVIPFEGGPVPCEEVWHPEAGADTAAATLLVTLPAEGELTPTAAAEVVGSGSGFLVTGTAAYVTTQTWNASPVTGIHRFDLATLTPTGSGSVPGFVPGPFGLNEHEGHLRVATSDQGGAIAVDIDVEGPAVDPAVVGPSAPAGGPLAEVFVLDLDGALDVVGRSGRFGHDGETIHGVRFVGDTGYVVTFLQTDPFWVLDLSNPTAPTVVGELEIPGFSAYLHPVGAEHVVGFGPGGDGRLTARLFDVGDPTTPTVVDELVLGDDSAVTWDHHALVALDGGRLAVPVNEYPDVVEERCAPAPTPTPVPLPEPQPLPTEPEPRPIDPGIGDGTTGSPGAPPLPTAVPPEQICEPIFAGGSTGVAVLAVEGDELVLADERTIDSDGSFTTERVLPAPDDRWVLVGWDRLIDPDGGEAILPAAGGIVEG